LRIYFTKNISCENSLQCSDKIKEKITTLTGDFSNCGHISIQHEQKNHKVWLFLYDENKKHESESKGKIVIQNNENVKKYSGVKVTKAEIEKLLD
tara:strand:+ start:580 stop:864 length:285 start_codon:yes stop_codon:yes gene_type:complete